MSHYGDQESEVGQNKVVMVYDERIARAANSVFPISLAREISRVQRPQTAMCRNTGAIPGVHLDDRMSDRYGTKKSVKRIYTLSKGCRLGITKQHINANSTSDKIVIFDIFHVAYCYSETTRHECMK